MKVMCVGEALIDMMCTDKGVALSEGDHFLKKPGGAPTNVAAAIAALGGNVELVTKLGNDPFGQQLLEVMRAFNVSTRYMFIDDHSFTSIAFVSLMQDGERDFVFNRGADGQLNLHDINSIDLSDIGIMHFGSATAFLPGPLQSAYQAMLLRALQQNIFISFDPNYRQLLFRNDLQTFISQCWPFLEQCHFFKVSDEEAMLITGAAKLEDSVDMLMMKTSAVFAVTLGKEGALLRTGDELVIVSSIPVEPVDTTGAGDAFVGALLYQLARYPKLRIHQLPADDWRKMLANANKAGAHTCEHMGAMEAFKYLDSSAFE